jgi:hypothetical protein
MTNQHPITPPPELFAEWLADAKRLHPGESTGFIAGEIARLAYQAGADQELEACCEWLEGIGPSGVQLWGDDLRKDRRPKPPSLKEQALEQLDGIATVFRMTHGGNLVCDTIRRALEALPE